LITIARFLTGDASNIRPATAQLNAIVALSKRAGQPADQVALAALTKAQASAEISRLSRQRAN